MNFQTLCDPDYISCVACVQGYTNGDPPPHTCGDSSSTFQEERACALDNDTTELDDSFSEIYISNDFVSFFKL